MDIEYCLMCGKEINLNNEKDYEYDDEGLVWCDPCFQRESDTGEI